jgi:uncharacterized protein YndB with AHSA1/START domain
MSSKFVYVIYIRTTAEKLWDALTKPEFVRRYWYNSWAECDWKVGSPWKLMMPEGGVADAGDVLVSNPPNRLVIRWRNEFRPELKAEGFTRCTFELTQNAEMTELIVTHESDRDASKMIEAVSGGWPKILSSLKSLIETGTAFSQTTRTKQVPVKDPQSFSGSPV